MVMRFHPSFVCVCVSLRVECVLCVRVESAIDTDFVIVQF